MKKYTKILHIAMIACINYTICFAEATICNRFKKQYYDGHCNKIYCATPDLKSYGLAYCFSTSLLDRLQNPQYHDLSLKSVCRTLDFNDEGFAELKKYVDEQGAHIPKYPEKRRELALIGGITKRCLKMYESPEYNAEVERIIKKYCKECE
ncbi:hypothetical protein [Helicobacter sp. T3_23-1059]